MKFQTSLLGLAAGLALASIAHAEVIVDNFDVDHVYGSNNVSGTIWSGILLNSGTFPEQNTTLVTAAATGGSLVLSTANGQWEQNKDDGYLLYLNVTGDFSATVHVDAPYVDFNTAGLMARDPNAGPNGAENYVTSLVLGQFNVGQHFRWVTNGTQSDGSNAGMNTTTGWLRLQRTGNLFEGFYSSDGVNFSSLGSVTRADMPSSLQLGLYQGTYSANTGTASFDNFSVTVVPEPATGGIVILGLGLTALARRRRK